MMARDSIERMSRGLIGFGVVLVGLAACDWFAFRDPGAPWLGGATLLLVAALVRERQLRRKADRLVARAEALVAFQMRLSLTRADR